MGMKRRYISFSKYNFVSKLIVFFILIVFTFVGFNSCGTKGKTNEESKIDVTPDTAKNTWSRVGMGAAVQCFILK